MDPVVTPSATPAPQPAAVAPAPAVTMAQQIADSQAPAAAQPAQAAGQTETPTSDAQPNVAPSGDSALKDKLADAEKRLQDTQRWGHKNAEEAAKLKAELVKLHNHPVVGKLLESMQQPAGQAPNPQAQQDEAEMRQAWAEYQTAKTEEEAFAKLLKFAETRSSRRAVAETEKVLQARAEQARAQQVSQQTVQLINKSVAETAPDVPLELFWAMSGRAEAETPTTMQDYSERLQWQVGRAIDLARGVLQPRVAQAAQSATAQATIVQQAGAIMSPGSVAPAAQPAGQPKIRNMADVIKDMQRVQAGQKAV